MARVARFLDARALRERAQEKREWKGELMREIYVEHEEGVIEDYVNHWVVTDDIKWLASFLDREDAEAYADSKRLEP